MKLNVKAFALASGIIWGLGLFFLTWWIIAFDGATHEVTPIGRLYRGYNISLSSDNYPSSSTTIRSPDSAAVVVVVGFFLFAPFSFFVTACEFL